MARRLLLTALLLTAALAGCTSPTDEDPPAAQPPGTGNGAPDPSCEKAVLPGEQDGQEGELLFLSCEGEGTGTQTGELSCPDPDGAELTAGTDLDAGQVRIAVADAGGRELVNRTLGDTNGEARELPMATEGAEPGGWTVRVDRLSGYDGEHRVELWCPQG